MHINKDEDESSDGKPDQRQIDTNVYHNVKSIVKNHVDKNCAFTKEKQQFLTKKEADEDYINKKTVALRLWSVLGICLVSVGGVAWKGVDSYYQIKSDIKQQETQANNQTKTIDNIAETLKEQNKILRDLEIQLARLSGKDIK